MSGLVATYGDLGRLGDRLFGGGLLSGDLGGGARRWRLLGGHGGSSSAASSAPATSAA